jgi:V/A-type H+-transporting ATPase subunit B
MEEAGLLYKTLSEIRGPLLFVERVKNAAYDELVKVRIKGKQEVLGRVLETSDKMAIVQVFANTEGMDLNVSVRFTGKTIKIPVSEEVIGRVFNGSFKPLDGLPPISKGEKRDVHGVLINPVARAYPEKFIQTGISSIDGMNTFLQGQKLPIFSEDGLPHNILAAQIARQATVPGEEFAVVFGGMGITHEEYEFFQREFERTGALENSVMVLNLAEDPDIERLITPRIALTIAEYLAFDIEMNVLVILTNMTNYCEALRVVSIAREEIPSRKGYPGYMYSDLAAIYERAGLVRGRKGSVTLMPILTMPSGDITHPIPDLTGYITEGQLILERDLHTKGLYPPLNVLPSLSRLMKDGIGFGKTRKDHLEVANQLYALYADGIKARGLAVVIGVSSLSERQIRYLRFAEEFENKFANQKVDENRSIEDTLNIAWDLLSSLSEDSLTRIRKEYVDLYRSKKFIDLYRSKKGVDLYQSKTNISDMPIGEPNDI